MTFRSSPELIRLYETYTAHPDSIGSKMAAAATAAAVNDPLIVATNADLVLFPGGGRDPEVEGFRFSTLGFKELAAVSHLGPAIASLMHLRAHDANSDLWRNEASRLLEATSAARSANSVGLWRDVVAVAAYRGREASIAAMIDYACELTERYLMRALRDPSTFTPQDLRENYLEARGAAIGASVPMNAVMIATFFLVGMDIGHRVIAWFDSHSIDWSRAMALIVGKQGRPTAGVTWNSNSLCALIRGASKNRLALERLYIAPHAPNFTVTHPVNIAAVCAFEEPMRRLWCQTRAVSELAPMMFDGYPGFRPDSIARPVLEEHTSHLSEMPAIDSPDDWRALNTRLRLVMEDPRQLLSGCVTDYAVDQLQANGNNPASIRVPGLDNMCYR